MKFVEVEFKYDIEDIVEHVAVPDLPIKLHSWGGGERVRYQIVAQLVEICYNGLQIHYHTRVVRPGGTVGERVQDFLEFELRPASAVIIVDADAERQKVQAEGPAT